MPDEPLDIEDLVRARLRTLRHAAGWSLDELAARSHVGASTISRIETGKRSIGLDVLLPLARALGVGVESLLDVDHDDADVVIRPDPTHRTGVTTWPLSRPGAAAVALKMRLEPSTLAPEPRVHPGHDWFYVVEGRVELTLGERTVEVAAGEAASFSTMTPHAIAALGGPAELIVMFDRDGEQAHVHTDR